MTVEDTLGNGGVERDPLADGLSNVELIQVQGSDRMICAAARVSYARDLDYYTDSTAVRDKDSKLLAYLLKNGHGSPFEHNLITFRVKAPLFVVQEMLRHRIGVSFNQQSGRYTEFLPEFYVPRVFRTQSATNKQSSDGIMDAAHVEDAGCVYEQSCADAYYAYKNLLEIGVPREQARGVLPHCTYTSLYITFNVRSLLHFLDLRLAPGAQWEIQQYAAVFSHYLVLNFPETYRAWIETREALTLGTDEGLRTALAESEAALVEANTKLDRMESTYSLAIGQIKEMQYAVQQIRQQTEGGSD